MTECFTYIWKDMKALAVDVNLKVEFLFKEMAEVKEK
jgi:hypothetical protein